MPPARVKSIDKLEEFRVHLIRFKAQTLQTLDVVELEIRCTLDLLQEQMGYWRREVLRGREMLNRGSEESRSTARLYLARADANLSEVMKWRRLVSKQAEEYGRQAPQLKAWLEDELPKADEFLKRKIDTLQRYVSTEAPSSGYATVSPTVASRAFAAPVGQAGVNEALPAAVEFARRLVNDICGKPDATRTDLAGYLISGAYPNFQERPVDASKYGFHRVFTTPDLPIIVLEESNLTVTESSSTWRGERESPVRIETRLEKKEFPDSTQRSSTDKRIASLVNDVGFDHSPAVAVVIDRERSQVNLYVHSADGDTWQLLPQAVVSTESPQTPSLLASTQSVTPILQSVPTSVLLQDIPLDQIDWDDVGKLTPADYRKVSYEEMQEGLRKFIHVVRPAVERGANADYFDQMDQAQGLDYPDGYRRIYDAFYGSTSCIIVEEVDGKYRVTNGRHRLTLARELGLTSLPMRVVAKEKQDVQAE
jgi:hypothetical protein